MLVFSTSAFAQVFDSPDLCPSKITKEARDKGLVIAQKVVATVEQNHAVSCKLKRSFKWMEFTSDIFKYKCEGTDGSKLRVRIVMSAEYCQPETVKLGKYKVTLN